MIIFQREKLCITEKIRVNLKKTQHFVTIEGSLNCSISNNFYVSLGSSHYFIYIHCLLELELLSSFLIRKKLMYCFDL